MLLVFWFEAELVNSNDQPFGTFHLLEPQTFVGAVRELPLPVVATYPTIAVSQN